MTQTKTLARLGQISKLVLDVKLAALQAATQRRQQSLDLLANLDGVVAKTDLTPVAAYQAELRYQLWAEARRAEINLVLARQTAEMLIAQDNAGEAFGKDQALRQVQGKFG